MAHNQVIYQGNVLIDLTEDTVDAAHLAQGYTAHAKNGQIITGTMSGGGGGGVYQEKTGITPSTSSQTITPDSGYDALSSVQINAMPSGTAGTPVASKGTVSNHSVTVTPSVTNTSGYITGSTKTGTSVTVSASELVSDSYSITANDTYDVTNYAQAIVNVTPSLQAKTGIVPSESSQTITPDSGYDGLSSVSLNAISSTYVGSGIAVRDDTDLSASGATVSVPAGYYADAETYTISSGSATPASSISATGATVSTGTNTLTLSKSVSNTPQVTAGYIANGTAGNSSVSLTAAVNTRSSSDLTVSGDTVTVPSGYYASQASKSVSSMTLPTSAASSATSGYTSKATIGRSTSAQYINIPPGYNSAGGYYTISATPNGTVTAPSSISGTTATVSTGTNTLTLTKTVSVTPSVTTAGYISSGTAGNSSVSLTASVTTKAATTYNTSTNDQTIASGTYLTGTQTIRGVTVSGLSAGNIASGVTVKVGDSADDDRITSVTGTLAFQTIYTGSSNPSSSTGVNGDVYIKT